MWNLLDLTIEFRGGCLVEACLLEAGLADCLEEPKGSQRANLGAVLRNVEADADVGLRAQIVYLVRLHIAKDLVERAGIVQVTVDEVQPLSLTVRVLVKVAESFGVEGAGAADYSVDVVPLAKEQFRQITTVLACDSGNQSSFSHGSIVTAN